jgi:ABC-type transporter Mla maintaining outer membrane lipid asymmetry permease subunit MlaE
LPSAFIIGQTVALLSRVGAQDFIGTVMVSVVIRELGPHHGIVVLARAGRPPWWSSAPCARWAKCAPSNPSASIPSTIS